MAQRCKKCGSFLTDTDRFCPNCGENVLPPDQQWGAPPQPANTPAQPYQTQSIPQNGMGMPPPPVYPSNAYRPAPFEEEMTLGKWVLTLFVTNFLGLISWIFLFIWGFGSGPKSRSNYCKAMLIVKAVGTVFAILFIIFYASVLIPGILEYAEYGDYDYTYAAISLFPRFFG